MLLLLSVFPNHHVFNEFYSNHLFLLLNFQSLCFCISQLFSIRLVVMSATLRVEDFTKNKKLFPHSPPILNIDERTHPVTLHFARKTEDDYTTAAVNKAMQIHRKLPPGSVLIFVTGRREVHRVCEELRRRTRAFRRGEVNIDTTEGGCQTPDDGTTGFLLSDEESDASSDAASLSSDSSDSEDEGGSINVPTQREDNVSHEVFNLDGESDREEEDEEEDEEDEDEYVLQPDGITIKRPHSYQSSTSDLPRPKLNERRKIDEKVNEKLGEKADEKIGEKVDEKIDEKIDEKGNEAQGLQRRGDAQNDRMAKALGFDCGYEMGTLNPKMTSIQQRWLGGGGDRNVRVKVVPLYALLSAKEQSKAFELPKDDERVIIVATNVAETSLTLPNIRLVICIQSVSFQEQKAHQ